MALPVISVGLYIPANPPLGLIRAYTLFARLIRLDSVVIEDHFQGSLPTAIWDEELSWLAAQGSTPMTSSTTRRFWATLPQGWASCALES
jgi:phthiodiolone/phenolphthiodiolone dimycocerosates ketoreductase